jgi:hypothetical protein
LKLMPELMTTHFQIEFHYSTWSKRAITKTSDIRVIYAFKTMS